MTDGPKKPMSNKLKIQLLWFNETFQKTITLFPVDAFQKFFLQENREQLKF